MSDAVLLLREEGILFAGDLAFINGHPWMGHGKPESWAVILEEIGTW